MDTLERARDEVEHEHLNHPEAHMLWANYVQPVSLGWSQSWCTCGWHSPWRYEGTWSHRMLPDWEGPGSSIYDFTVHIAQTVPESIYARRGLIEHPAVETEWPRSA
jgi:hypothetical protein